MWIVLNYSAEAIFHLQYNSKKTRHLIAIAYLKDIYVNLRDFLTFRNSLSDRPNYELEHAVTQQVCRDLAPELRSDHFYRTLPVYVSVHRG